MLYLYVFAIVLHVACAAAWFGLSLRLPGLSKTIVGADAVVGKALAESGAATVRMMNVFVILLYVFAMLAIVLGPGFANLASTFNMALGLGLLLIPVQLLLIARNWKALTRSVDVGRSAEARGKVAMSLGIGHLLWLILLALMFAPRLMVG